MPRLGYMGDAFGAVIGRLGDDSMTFTAEDLLGGTGSSDPSSGGTSYPSSGGSSSAAGAGSSVDWTAVATGLISAGSQIATQAIKSATGQGGTSGYVGSQQTQGGGGQSSGISPIMIGGGLLLAYLFLK